MLSLSFPTCWYHDYITNTFCACSPANGTPNISRKPWGHEVINSAATGPVGVEEEAQGKIQPFCISQQIYSCKSEEHFVISLDQIVFRNTKPELTNANSHLREETDAHLVNVTKIPSCYQMEFSNQNLSFPYLNAGCHLTGPVLNSCRAIGHCCTMPIPSSSAWQVARGWPALPGWCSLSSTRVKGPLGWSSLWQAWPQLPLWDHWPNGAEPPEMLEPDLSSQWGFCRLVLWTHSVPELKGAKIVAGKRGKKWEVDRKQWLQMRSINRSRKQCKLCTVGGDKTLQWKDGGEKERSSLSCLHVSRGEQQWLLTSPFSYYSSISVRIKSKNPVILHR